MVPGGSGKLSDGKCGFQASGQRFRMDCEGFGVAALAWCFWEVWRQVIPVPPGGFPFQLAPIGFTSLVTLLVFLSE